MFLTSAAATRFSLLPIEKSTKVKIMRLLSALWVLSLAVSLLHARFEFVNVY